MEYMVSGTPVLTTRLPGMPKEYEEYVYLFDNESVGGMAKKITEVLSIPEKELRKKGASAREFVLKEKNNISQAKKLLDFINKTGFPKGFQINNM